MHLPLLFAALLIASAEGSLPAVEAENSNPEKPGQTRSDNGVKMILHYCPPGTFLMGSPEDEPARDAYETQHKVTLTEGFWMAETEVTQGQWQQVMNLSLQAQARKMLADETLYPFNGKQITLRESLKTTGGEKIVESAVAATSPNIPVYYVSWDDAVEFCLQLTLGEQHADRLPKGWKYALPTEAQWEYACRAGTTTSTYAGPMKILGENNAPILDKIAWYGGNSSVGYKGAGWETLKWPHQAHPGKVAGPRRVGQKQANAWGLRDMLGNVYEWVSDFSTVCGPEDVTDPTGPDTGRNHPYRGGAWNHYASMSRCAKSFEAPPTYRVHHLGFRVVMVKE
ncbi:MAG: formylglycine-generating enzyme family protein [Verrucomicrobiota bacterium]